MEGSQLRDWLHRFSTLQEQRVKVYKDFDKGFRAYLSSAPHYDFETYRKMVHNITEQFSNLSESIIEVETKLKENGRSNLADAIRKIQLKEKNKLELTAKLQVEERNRIDHPDNQTIKDLVADSKKRLLEVTENINELLEELRYEAEDILVEGTG